MLIGLASGNTFLETGEMQGAGTLATVSQDIAAVAKQAFYDFGERPLWTERMTYGTGECFIHAAPLELSMGTTWFRWICANKTALFYYGGDGSGTAVFSGRREGFALYFARLIRPIWKARLTQPG